jgi:hypothetical protein
MSVTILLLLFVLQVFTPPDIPVGLWKFSVESKPKDNLKAQHKVFTYADKIYLLFNPWTKGKSVLINILIITDSWLCTELPVLCRLRFMMMIGTYS